MDCHRRRAALLRDFRYLHRIYAVYVPAGAYLHRHRDMRGFHSSPYYIAEKLRSFHERAPRAAGNYLWHGAAGIYVDNVGLKTLGYLHCALHELRLVSEKLHRHRALPGSNRKQLGGLSVVVAQALAACHLADHIAGSVFLRHDTVRPVGYARHRSKRGGLFYLYAAYIGVFHRFSSHSADFHHNFILLLYHKMQNCSSSSCNFS